MRYREFSPAPSVAQYVARYWAMSVGEDITPGTLHRVLPDGCLDIVVVQRGAVVLAVVRGPRDTPLLIPLEPGDRYWGARLWPDTGALLTGLPAEKLVGQRWRASDLFDRDADGLVRAFESARSDEAAPAILDGWLTPRIATIPPVDGAVRLAIIATNALDGSIGLDALAAMAGLSPRQLQRRFRRATGLTIKTYARIRRLRRAVTHLVDGEPRSWGEVAASRGFADQSHLVREFTSLAGARPSEIAAYISGIQHVNVLP